MIDFDAIREAIYEMADVAADFAVDVVNVIEEFFDDLEN